MAIGFVGDLNIASDLLQKFKLRLQKRSRKDPISLSNWMTRFFKREYSAFISKSNNCRVEFMVAATIRGHTNVVDRDRIDTIIDKIISGNTIMKRNDLPPLLFEIMRLPKTVKKIELKGITQGFLCVMRAPDFEIEQYQPLQFAVIGSGNISATEIDRYHDFIFAFDIGNTWHEAHFFRETIQRYMATMDENTVGGLYPVVKVTNQGIEMIGHYSERPVGGTKVELIYKDNYWLQRNITTGKEIKIVPPWEIQDVLATHNQTFNDLANTYRKNI